MMHVPRTASSPSPFHTAHHSNNYYYQQQQHHHHQEQQQQQQQHHQITPYTSSYQDYHGLTSDQLAKSIPRQHLQQQLQHHHQYFNHHPSSSSSAIASPYNNYPSNNSYSSVLPLSRPLPPHISVQKPSEPSSPATIATTISAHSTPSPSPNKSLIMSEPVIANNDFTLYDESSLLPAAHIVNSKLRSHSHHTLSDSISTVGDDSLYDSNSSHYSTSSFPIIVSSDNSYANNNYADVNPYNYAHLATDTATPLYDASNPQRLLQPSSSYHTNNNNYSHTLPRHNESTIMDSRQPDEEDVPALSPANSRRRTSSRPSVSSVDTYKSALSEQNDEPDDKTMPNFTPSIHLQAPVPKLGRTYSDAVQDELYNPGLIRPSEYTPQKRQPKKASHKSNTSTGSNLKNMMASFPDLLDLAQQQHQNDLAKSLPRGPDIARDHSPFRANSPFHPSINSKFSPAYKALQAPNKQEQGTSQRLFPKDAESAVDPKTISPRDALLEYTEPEGDNGVQLDLFAPLKQESSGLSGLSQSQEESTHLHPNMQQSSQNSDMDNFQSMATSRRGSMAASSSSSSEYPQHYSQPAYNNDNGMYYNGNNSTAINTLPDTQSQVYNTQSSDDKPYISLEKPTDSRANSGTYTCTYSGCGHRFTTSAKLQKHRRETHRKSPATQTSVSTAAAIASRNAQPGPHRCMRPNANGKACNSVFSRPYDLTRHEDTIHNSRKEKVRCEICNDEKTFSRPDALVRHRRVKHGIH